jgi:hypothetical protein
MIFSYDVSFLLGYWNISYWLLFHVHQGILDLYVGCYLHIECNLRIT